jgi:hypothetical protein
VAYTLRIEAESEPAKEYKLSRNHLALDAPLKAGDYSWTVTYDGPDGSSATSAPRLFRIAADAKPFVIPPAAVMLSRASATPRPRSFPPGPEGDAVLAALAGTRADGFRILVAGVEARSQQPLPREPAGGSTASEVWAVAAGAASRLDQALLAAYASQRDDLWAIAKRQSLNLAAWDPVGSTGFAVDDQSSRVIAVSLTRAYDWGYQRFSASERKVLETAISRRMKELYDGIVREGWNAIWNYPFDSHGENTLGQLAFMSAVMAGTSPTMDGWFKVVVPLYFELFSPFGGEDGGYANGTNYSYWQMGGLFQSWDTLRWSTGVDLRLKSFVNVFGLYWVYFTPPGTPGNLFGDGAENVNREVFARYSKEYISRISSPLLRWYAGQLKGEQQGVPDYLLSPPVDFPNEPFPAGTSNDLLLGSIGWAAMHSDLKDPGRASLYFKSSPFGSFNHSHADQNSFVIDVGGKRLAIDSGYYDGYGTKHWSRWYKQTRAHNAITFDGGIGQSLGDRGDGDITARGQVVAFASQSDYAFATGDATAAYGGLLSKAIRSTVFLKPQVILVFDHVISDVPRSFEWNIHAANSMQLLGPTEVRIADDSASICVKLYSSEPVEFTQTNAFTAMPQGAYPAQAHGTFTTPKVTAASFVAVIRINCVATNVTVTPGATGWEVSARGKMVTFDGVTIDVQ